MKRRPHISPRACAWLMAAALLLAGCSEPKVPVGAQVPPLRFLDGDGRIHALADIREDGPALLLFMRGFEGFVCPYCIKQTLELLENRATIERSGAEVVIVYPGVEQDARKFIAAIRRHRDTTPGEDLFVTWLDLNGEALAKLGVDPRESRPATFIVDSEGRLVYRYVGRNREDRPAVEALLQVIRELAAETQS